MQIPITGQAYVHPSQDVNNQRCLNLFPTTAGDLGRGQAVLLPTPGLTTLVDSGGDEVRGLIVFDDSLYTVIDNTFYLAELDKDAVSITLTSKGELASFEGHVQMERNATQIMIVDEENNGYVYTPSSDSFVEITDGDFTGAGSLVYMDSYFVFNNPGTDDVYTTAVGDGTSIDPLDVVSAEAAPDRVIGLAVDKRELWVFGEKSIEVYYNSANATGFPFSRRDGAHLDIGCSARKSIVNTENTLFWLDSRGYVIQSQGYDLSIVSTEAIHAEIASYDEVSDAFAFSYQDRGHTMYVISFPTPKKTWVYDATIQSWHERAYYNDDNEFEHHLANCIAEFKRWHIVGDRRSGKIYRMSHDYRDDAGVDIHRIRTSSFLNSEFQELTIDELELHIEAGKGTVTGTGSDPMIQLRYSNDGGYTWSHSMVRSMGKLGEYDTRVRWNRLGLATEWLFEFRIVEPVDFSLIDASVMIGGR